MPNNNSSPKIRALRSASQPDTLLSEIKDLRSAIEASKNEVIQALRIEIESLRNTVKSLTNRVADLEQQNKELQAKCKECSVIPEDLPNKIVEECEERRQRECNVFVVGLPESTAGEAGETPNHDEAAVQRMLRSIDVADVKIKRLRRVGKHAHRGKRPLLITFSDVADKWKVLKKASKLRRSPNYSSVFINEDRTQLQQLHRKRQLEELKRRRQNGENVVLYGDRVILRDMISQQQKNVHSSADVSDQ